MKAFGYALITAGFVAGSFFAVRDAEVIPWPLFGAAMAMAVAGVALVRFTIHKTSRRVDVIASNLETLGATLERITKNAERFESDKESFDVYDLRHHVDDVFRGDLEAFVDARESMAHSFGLQAYAEVMSHFASGERNLNRVWSASTDGYIDEAHAYVTKALMQFREAHAAFGQLGEGGTA